MPLDRDTRAKKFKKKHGDACVELDALPPTELRLRVRHAVENHLDADVWQRAVGIEKAEIASIADVVKRWQGHVVD